VIQFHLKLQQCFNLREKIQELSSDSGSGSVNTINKLCCGRSGISYEHIFWLISASFVCRGRIYCAEYITFNAMLAQNVVIFKGLFNTSYLDQNHFRLTPSDPV